MNGTRLTIRIPQTLQRKLNDRAREHGTDQSTIARQALESYLTPTETAYEAFVKAGLIGTVKDGPRDLSTNKKHMEGLGRNK